MQSTHTFILTIMTQMNRNTYSNPIEFNVSLMVNSYFKENHSIILYCIRFSNIHIQVRSLVVLIYQGFSVDKSITEYLTMNIVVSCQRKAFL